MIEKKGNPPINSCAYLAIEMLSFITLHYQHYHKALAPLDISRLVAYVDRFVVDGLIKELRLKRSLMLLQHEILSTLAK